MAVVFKKTSMLTDTPFHYCPGCTHGIIHRLVAEDGHRYRTGWMRGLCLQLF